MNKREYDILGSITYEPGPDGITIVTARIPSHAVREVMYFLQSLVLMTRVVNMKCRASEAIYKARSLNIIS